MPTQRDISKLSITQLAWICRCAKDTASKKLREAKLEPAGEDGKTTFYDPRDAVPILLGVGEGLNPAAEKARLDRAKAELAELELQEKRGELAPVEDQESVLIALVTTLASRMDGVPPQAAHEVARESDPAVCQEIIARHIRAAREELAEAGARAVRAADRSVRRSKSAEDRRDRARGDSSAA